MYFPPEFLELGEGESFPAEGAVEGGWSRIGNIGVRGKAAKSSRGGGNSFLFPLPGCVMSGGVGLYAPFPQGDAPFPHGELMGGRGEGGINGKGAPRTAQAENEN